MLLILAGCSDSNKITVTDFSEPMNLALEVDKNKSYTTKLFEIKGEVDDSVYVKMCDICYNFYLDGKIDTVFRSDFYGGGVGMDSTHFYFDPYKANTGELELKYTIL